MVNIIFSLIALTRLLEQYFKKRIATYLGRTSTENTRYCSIREHYSSLLIGI